MPRWSSGTPDADRRLVQGLHQGDEETLGVLYDTYAEQLFDYCVAMVAEERRAADIVHDAFIDAQRRAPRMRNRMQLRAWLYAAVRRRCLRGGRAAGMSWRWAAASAWAQEPGAAEAEVTPEEARRLVEAMLGRLDFLHRETLVLTLRHGMSPADISAVLGVSARRVAALVAQAEARAEAAITAELRAMVRHCHARRDSRERSQSDPAAEPQEAPEEQPVPAGAAGGGSPVTALRHRSAVRLLASGGTFRRRRLRRSGTGRADLEPQLARHLADCTECWRRGRVAAGSLLKAAPAPVPPAALRRRVLHTATDPELAPHRTDIAARGGPLTPAGLPRQPDMPSPYARRWLFLGGGAAGALLAAMVAILMMGPVTANLRFPFDPRPQPSTEEAREKGAESGDHPALAAPGAGGMPGPGGGYGRTPSPGPPFGEVPPDEPPEDRTPQPPGPDPSGPPGPSPSPNPTQPPDPSQPPQPPYPSQPPLPSPSPPPPAEGRLVVGPASVVVGRQGATITLTAQDGPVVWTAVTTSDKLSLSLGSGTLQAGASVELQVVLARRSLINLPGNAAITVTDAAGNRHEVQVKWRLSLF